MNFGVIGSSATQNTATKIPIATASQLNAQRISFTIGHIAQTNNAPTAVFAQYIQYSDPASTFPCNAVSATKTKNGATRATNGERSSAFRTQFIRLSPFARLFDRQLMLLSAHLHKRRRARNCQH